MNITLEEFNQWFDPIFNDLYQMHHNENISIKDTNCGSEQQLSSDLINQIDDEGIIEFYSFIDEWRVRWKTSEKSMVTAEGTFSFLPIEKVMQNTWDKDFGADDWAPSMKGFRPLDLFYDSDGMVGFFTKETKKPGLYLMHSDSSLSALRLNFKGYLKLLAVSKGYGWWQNSLVQISTGEHMPNVARFKEDMPKLFPDFNWDEFVSLYQSLRIDK